MKPFHSRVITLTAFTIVQLTAGAQQLSPQTICPGGQSYIVGALLLESNIGGLVVADNSTAVFLYTPGFLQPENGTTSNIPSINDVVLSSGSGIDIAGTSFKAGNAGIDFTVGEWVSITHLNSSHILTQGILQPFELQATLPVTGLSFAAKRTGASQVQLNWKTLQESNNHGFTIERKRAYESYFSAVGFAASRAPEGNSTLPLEYAVIDTNAYNGKSWYRLLQQDKDGRGIYSMVRLVAGSEEKTVSLKAWPVPTVGPFTVLAEGIGQEQLQVFDMSGKLRQRQVIQNGIPLRMEGLPAGTYLLRLAGARDLVVKVVVQ